MSLDDKLKTTTKVLTGAAAVASAVKVEVSDQHHEVERVAVLGIPLFVRDDKGLPRVFGVKFPRWIRGPRKE